ncbi:MAG: hypothetical protein NTV05_16240 [Acidobacteria bacterium]|nr:hypothetical protein [Acidobacteriota bacterium]
MPKLRNALFLALLLLVGSAQTGWGQTPRDLGHAPNGTWAALNAVNDSGMAVGWGDVAGDTRMLGLKLSPDSDLTWIVNGMSSNEMWASEGMGISSAGIVAGHIRSENGEARAYAWNVDDKTGVDLGTLPGDDGSAAIAINSSGTLIVGNSYHWLNARSIWATAVVWRLEQVWNHGQPTERWVIHVLPTGGLEQHNAVFRGDTLNNWSGWGVNDLGQIVGDAWTNKYDEIAVVWNPDRNGGWTVQRLPNVSTSSGKTYGYTEALSINNQGEIVGDMSADAWNTTTPAYWMVSPPPKHHVWNLTELGYNQVAIAWCINDVGDIVGMNYDSASHIRAARWVTTDPGNAIQLVVPGDYSRALGVNNHGVVVGRYRLDTTGPLQAFAATIIR